MAIKSRYRIKNNSGSYDIVHLETTADQVIVNNDRQFVTKEEKENISKIKNYLHIQNENSTSWNINHNLNRFPSVTIIDNLGEIVIGDIFYIDENNITINFNTAINGKAYLN